MNFLGKITAFVVSICLITTMGTSIQCKAADMQASTQCTQAAQAQTAAAQTQAAQAAAATVQTQAAIQTPIVQKSSIYTYDEMCQDMISLATLYPDYIHIGSIGCTALGRLIPYIILGDINAPHSIMVQGSIHAREYICTQVIMGMAEEYASNSYPLGNVNLYIIPMANPDGVTIAQFGSSAASDAATQQFICNTGHTCEWKANALGVDLNRNFDIGWSAINQGVCKPSYMLYKGSCPASQSEVQALTALAVSIPFSAYISYHMAGEVIYYDEPGNLPSTSAASQLLASTAAGITGYKIVNLNSCVSSSGAVVQGGFTDWVQLILNKPAITLEIGTQLPPKGQKKLSSVYKKNLMVWSKIALLYNT